jgi:ketosteroid isomerase-like protein
MGIPRGAEDDPERAAIQGATAELLAAVNASDYRRLLAVWADDGVLMPPNRAAVHGRRVLEDYFRERFAGTRFRFAFTSSDVQRFGEVAFERLGYSAVIWPAGGGAPLEDAGKGLHVYRRQPDGSWRLALDISNSDRPAESAGASPAPPAPPPA